MNDDKDGNNDNDDNDDDDFGVVIAGLTDGEGEETIGLTNAQIKTRSVISMI